MNNKFNNGFKTVAALLQMVFLMIVIVVFSLMVNLFVRNRLSFRDIGNGYSFFQSYYYSEEISEEIKSLMLYLQIQRGMKDQVLKEPENSKYKLYKLKYDSGESNLYYWFLDDDMIYTNMKNVKEVNEAIEMAKNLGNYLYYDDFSINLQGNIAYFEQDFQIDVMRLFQTGKGGALVVGVDTSLPKKDSIAKAESIYKTYLPWIGICLFVMIAAFLSFLLIMIYLTLATGRNEDDDNIRLYRIDYIPTELLFMAMILFVAALIAFCAKLGGKDLGISSSLILTGTLVFLSDSVLLTLYLSFVRKIKADQFVKCSISSYIIRTLKQAIYEQGIEKRGMIRISICSVLELFFLLEVFIYHSVWAVLGLLCVFLYSAV